MDPTAAEAGGMQGEEVRPFQLLGAEGGGWTLQNPSAAHEAQTWSEPRLHASASVKSMSLKYVRSSSAQPIQYSQPSGPVERSMSSLPRPRSIRRRKPEDTEGKKRKDER